jgi:S-(hydroxymethyl)glutathione dehydrogenase / alcohol dehydrogenase
MKAAVINDYNGIFEIKDVAIDKPRGREVLVEIKASGLCHTDLHLAENNFGTKLPGVFGHEIAGIVKEIGPDVRDFKVGDHVVGGPVQFCGHCHPCLDGRTYHCDHPEETLRAEGDEPRLTLDGEALTPLFGTSGFAEFSLVHENQLAAVPKEMPFPQASLLGCGCITGAGAAINTARVKAGETVVVLGLGGVGLSTVAGARLCGASRVIAVDISPAKEEVARKFGATDFVCAGEVDAVEAVRKIVPYGVDRSFEAVGLKVTSEQALRMTRKGGFVYMIGVHKPDATIDINVFNDLINQQLTITGVLMGSSNPKHDIPMYADLYLQGRFNLDDLVSREINISEINEAYKDVKGGALARNVITSF